MVWNKKQIDQHKEVSRILYKIMMDSFDFISKNKKNVYEKDVQEFIHNKFRKHKLKKDGYKMIVAFNESAAIPHYFVKGKGKKLCFNKFSVVTERAYICTIFPSRSYKGVTMQR